ncbi:type II toxin-antitoxin system RelE/ParE family toxin [Sphingopyxis sp. DBS4]|uniref:type II toxin-antitoxin system RelE/ParE family toxin n=1 Tax=Sphingopyxis sp. DBS4 TaxID=2968500 RepID=UPI00214C357C|nr:type II toxin-antitoxin system RelE/ParE family toxin [Sphingopyxis sp. DBS4]
MKRVIWTEAAINDLHAIERYLVETYSPVFARQIIASLIEAAHWLLDHPHGGSPLQIEGWRKWRPRKSRHILIYRTANDGIEVLRVRQERNDWRPVPQD